ncbi:MAG: hypothetical protein NT076_03795 [Candidatus Pacearchaeota archaeon]|nr:hypothetical protein [Candidatus Pacearchaeota archaeon]
MGFLESIRKFFRRQTKIVEVPIDADSIRENHLVKALSYENAELKGKNAKLETEIGKQRQAEKDLDEEENVKVALDEKKKELRMLSQGQVFSLRSFFAKYFRDKKFRDKLAIYSFDRSTKLANFGDLAIADDGDFVLLDKKLNMVLRMSNLKDLFQSVGALGVDVASAKIPIWLDKNGGYIENVMEYEAPELISTGNKLKFAKARKRPVYEIIQGLNNQIGELQQDLAESEMMNTQLQNKLDSLDSTLRVNETMAETSRAELTTNEERLTGIDRVFRNTQRDMLRLQTLNQVEEDNINKLENEIEIMREKAEREGVKLADEKVLDLITRIRSTLVNELPDSPPAQVSQGAIQGTK